MTSGMKFGRQKGVSLLEVLITIVIVSFGLLGIAGLIVNSLKSNQSSYARTQATLLANEIVERMRANRADADDSTKPYDLALTDATPTGTSVPQTDLAGWRSRLSFTLPSGTGSVKRDDVSGNVTVVVQWNNSRVEGGSETQQVKLETRL